MLFHIMRQTLYVAVPLMIVALGGLFSERSGIINIALEGIMVFASFFGILIMHILEDSMSGQALYLIALLVAALSGMFIAAFHAYASINMNADQTISGTAINLFAPAFTIYTARLFYSVKEIPFKNTFLIREIPILSKIPLLGPVLFQRTYISTFIGIALLFFVRFLLYETRFGLRLRAAGDNPHALEAAGVSVHRMRWLAVVISGALAGMGGLMLTVPISTAFSGTANGYGFLAIAILIFGQWQPRPILYTSLFFSLTLVISNTYSAIPFLLRLNIPEEIFKMLPYLATLIVLFFTSKTSTAPKALGEPYDQGKR